MAKHRRPRPVGGTNILSDQPKPPAFPETSFTTSAIEEKVPVAVRVGQWLQDRGFILSSPDGTRLPTPAETNYGVVLPDGNHVANIFLNGSRCYLIAFGGMSAGVDHLSGWLSFQLGLSVEVSFGPKETVPYGF